MRAGNIGATKAEAITVGMFAGAHIIAACVVIPLIRAGLPTTK